MEPRNNGERKSNASCDERAGARGGLDALEFAAEEHTDDDHD